MKAILMLLCALSLQARSVFLLGSVRMYFSPEKTVQAELSYRGSGQMEGRWELLRPVEEQPEAIGRFRMFLPPSGKMTLAGPEWSALPHDGSGAFIVLMRVERVADKGGDAELQMGAIPVLRYWAGNAAPSMTLTGPEDGTVSEEASPELRFVTGPSGIYRLEIADPFEKVVLRALLPAGAASYRLPPWITGEAGRENRDELASDFDQPRW